MDYDQAAVDYAAQRHVHRAVVRELSERGRLRPGATILEVGCGNGNYTGVLARGHGCTVIGLDLSSGMLAQARTRPEPIGWVQGRAEALPISALSFDLVFSVDVIPHVVDKEGFYQEVARVLRSGGTVCTVTDSEEIIRRREILSGYFPATVPIELARYPSIAQLAAWMAAAGLGGCETVTVEEPYQIADAQAYRSKTYSSLHLISDEAWQAGLERLERDLTRGPVTGVARYVCVWGRRL
jgi:ubiquinone/menaquinone biosynthesis C-methylase UbiE